MCLRHTLSLPIRAGSLRVHDHVMPTARAVGITHGRCAWHTPRRAPQVHMERPVGRSLGGSLQSDHTAIREAGRACYSLLAELFTGSPLRGVAGRGDLSACRPTAEPPPAALCASHENDHAHPYGYAEPDVLRSPDRALRHDAGEHMEVPAQPSIPGVDHHLPSGRTAVPPCRRRRPLVPLLRACVPAYNLAPPMAVQLPTDRAAGAQVLTRGALARAHGQPRASRPVT